jgi:hypothetical protein
VSREYSTKVNLGNRCWLIVVGKTADLVWMNADSSVRRCCSGITSPQPAIVVVDSDQYNPGVGVVGMIIRPCKTEPSIAALIAAA